MKVLIVDDSKIQRNIIKNLLNSMKDIEWELWEAANAFDAISTLEQLYLSGRNLDLILLDWIMPGPKGIDFLKEIRLNGQYQDIKVIIITSDDDQNHAIEAIKNGASGFLIKPVSVSALGGLIRPLFGL